MKVTGINNLNLYSNINNNKAYATRPVFKQDITDYAQRAVVDQFIESANDKKHDKALISKFSFLKEVLFSDSTSIKAKQLQEVLDSYDSKHNVLFTV